MGDESGGCSNIPEDLLEEIFLYLPVKSLIRFTCVCKSWLYLIRNNHQFALKHYLTRSTASSEVLDNVDYMFDILRNGKPCLYAFNEAKQFRFLKKFECVPDKPISVSNSCHGIICFDICLGSEILLCNPAIQEVISLPPRPNKGGRAALGFDPINKDYKVVTVTFPIEADYRCTVDVYSVCRGHWRNQTVNASVQGSYRTYRDAASNANGRMCNWLAFRSSNEIFVSFDMVDEVLKELPLPKCSHHQKHFHELLSSTRWQACLSCFSDTWDFDSRFIDVWVLKDWIWSKEFAVKCPDHEPMRPLNIWLNDNELLVAIRETTEIHQVFHYDVTTHQLKHTKLPYSHRYYHYARGYMESLVSIKLLMSLQNECKHGLDNKQGDDQYVAFKQEQIDGFVIREVSRKRVRCFRSSKLIQASK